MKVNKKIIQFFSALSDETRLKILLVLISGEKKVGEIHKAVEGNLTLSAISHQLKQLSDVEIIVYEKKGREKIFRLSSDFCWCMLRDAVEHFDNIKLEKNCCIKNNKK